MPQKILVADDELDIRKLAQIILERNGYEVSLAADGAETLQKAENELPDLILLDVVMPGQSGWEICRILKSQDRARHISVVIFSASLTPGEEDSKRRAEEVGADGYLAKPFNASELVIEVKKHLDRRGELA